MGDGVPTDEMHLVKMGATGNANAARIFSLQERKLALEKALAEKNEQLKTLCIQEAELTGVMPSEIPLEPGEIPPAFRRRVGTSFQLPQNLVCNLNNEDDSIATLELQIQLHASMAEAAHNLATAPNVNKGVRRQNLTQYERHKKQVVLLEKKLNSILKYQNTSTEEPVPGQKQQQKQKKKLRSPQQDDDTVSMKVNMQQNNQLVKVALRHSMRSLHNPLMAEGEMEFKQSVPNTTAYRNSDITSCSSLNSISYQPSEEQISKGIYALSLNGYKAYMERKESGAVNVQGRPQHSANVYDHHQSLPYPPMSSQTLPSHLNKSYSLRSSQQSVIPNYCNPHYNQTHYIKYNTHSGASNRRQDSPDFNHLSVKSLYYPSHTCDGQISHRTYSSNTSEMCDVNPHQLQPHQQYERDVMTTGLGGFWSRSENGELTWCTVVLNENWQRDKRFGSLDRRRNKRLHKRITQPVDCKPMTMISHHEATRKDTSKAHPVGNVSNHTDRQLARTQSLGSVGVRTVDGVWPSDDNNSSCGSDAHSINDNNSTVRRHKQKEWYETSLDGPVPMSKPASIQESTVLSISPDDKYESNSNVSTLRGQKSCLEIPAESNVPIVNSPRQESFMELLNNNNNNNNSHTFPKHGTVVQVGQCKPYHEETKPFEMSDFYKYSTKFNRSPAKQQSDGESQKLSVNVKHEDRNVRRNGYPPTLKLFASNNNFEAISPGQCTKVDWYEHPNAPVDIANIRRRSSTRSPEGSKSATLV